MIHPAAVAKIINPIGGLVISIGIPTKEAKVEMETHPVIVKITIKKCLI